MYNLTVLGLVYVYSEPETNHLKSFIGHSEVFALGYKQGNSTIGIKSYFSVNVLHSEDVV